MSEVWKLKKKIFQVSLTYNIEMEDGGAVEALDEVLGKHPLKPIAFSCEPIEVDEDDDD